MKMVDFKKIKTISAKDKKFIVNYSEFAKPFSGGGEFSKFMDSIPNILAGKDFREVISAMRNAKAKRKPIIWGIGPHVLKVGLSPLLIKLMEEGYVSAIAMNGAGAIHDYELAFYGMTSEKVAEGIEDGSYGMSKQTGEFINSVAKEAAENNEGFGNTLGKKISSLSPPHKALSLYSSAYDEKIPATLHVAIGTDTVHIHPSADGAALGKASFKDFELFASEVSNLSEGGVFVNVGSAVLLPEVFLKSLTACNNLGFKVKNFFTVNFDFIKQYREMENVVKRPTLHSGRGYSFVGHHEFLIPLLAASLLNKR